MTQIDSVIIKRFATCGGELSPMSPTWSGKLGCLATLHSSGYTMTMRCDVMRGIVDASIIDIRSAG
jgi:hypothetical protein